MAELHASHPLTPHVSKPLFAKWVACSQSLSAQADNLSTQSSGVHAKQGAQKPRAARGAKVIGMQQTRLGDAPRILNSESNSLFETFGQFDRLT